MTTTATLTATFTTFGIQPKFFAEMDALITQGKRPGAELRRRLRSMRNYRECLNHLLDELARPTIEKHFHATLETTETIHAESC